MCALEDRRLAASGDNEHPHPKTPHTHTAAAHEPARGQGQGDKEQGARREPSTAPHAARHSLHGQGLTGGRINSTHGPERGSLHFNRCGCAGLGAARQCGNASGRAREPRPATIPLRGGTTSRHSRHSSSSSSRSRHSDCHLPPPATLPTPTHTPTTPPQTVPTAGSLDHRSSPSASASSSLNTTALTISNSCDQPRPTTTAAAAQAATGTTSTASRAGLPHPGRSGTCASHHHPLPTLDHAQNCFPSILPSIVLDTKLTGPRAIPAKCRRPSNLLSDSRPFPNNHNSRNNRTASYTRRVPTRDTSPVTPSPAARPRLSTRSPRPCTPPLRPSATAPTCRGHSPKPLTTSLPRARPSCCPPEMCTSSPSLLRREKYFKRWHWPYAYGTIP